MKVNKINKFLPVFLLVLLLLPTLGLALSTGISPLDSGVSTISKLFNIRALSNPVIREGFYKFMFFIFIFSVSFLALQKVPLMSDDKGRKTAGIVAFVISTISVFTMPTNLLNATGNAIGSFGSSLIFIAFFWGLTYVAVIKLKTTDGEEGGWFKNLAGITILILLLFAIQGLRTQSGFDGLRGSSDLGQKIYYHTLEWTEIIILIGVINKFWHLIAGGFKFSQSPITALGQSIKNAFGGGSSSTISQVQDFDGVVFEYPRGVPTPPEVRLWWKANPATESITAYRIERLKPGRSWGIGAWESVSMQPRNFDKAAPYVHTKGIIAGSNYQYRIRAEGPAKGQWFVRMIGPPPAAPAQDFSTQLNDIETALNQSLANALTLQTRVNTFLPMHRAYHLTGRPRVNYANHLNDIANYEQQVSNQLATALTIISAVRLDPKFGTMVPAQRHTFGLLNIRAADITRRLGVFSNEFTRRFRINDAGPIRF